jgi:ankyrin repeat protein
MVNSLEDDLYKAVDKGDIAKVKELINKGANVNYITESNNHSLLRWAVDKDNVEMAKLLIANGAEINNGYGEPLLIRAVIGGRISMLKFLLEKGVDINVKDKHGQTALMHAAHMGARYNVVKYLLEQGADVSIKSKNGYTALDNAIKAVNPYVIELIRDAMNKKTYGLIQAIEEGSIDKANHLVKEGADVKEKDGRTALMLAISAKNLAMVQTLIDKGADITVQDNKGNTVFQYAIDGGDEKIISLLNKLAVKEALKYIDTQIGKEIEKVIKDNKEQLNSLQINELVYLFRRSKKTTSLIEAVKSKASPLNKILVQAQEDELLKLMSDYLTSQAILAHSSDLEYRILLLSRHLHKNYGVENAISFFKNIGTEEGKQGLEFLKSSETNAEIKSIVTSLEAYFKFFDQHLSFLSTTITDNSDVEYKKCLETRMWIEEQIKLCITGLENIKNKNLKPYSQEEERKEIKANAIIGAKKHVEAVLGDEMGVFLSKIKDKLKTQPMLRNVDLLLANDLIKGFKNGFAIGTRSGFNTYFPNSGNDIIKKLEEILTDYLTTQINMAESLNLEKDIIDLKEMMKKEYKPEDMISLFKSLSKQDFSVDNYFKDKEKPKDKMVKIIKNIHEFYTAIKIKIDSDFYDENDTMSQYMLESKKWVDLQINRCIKGMELIRSGDAYKEKVEAVPQEDKMEIDEEPNGKMKDGKMEIEEEVDLKRKRDIKENDQSSNKKLALNDNNQSSTVVSKWAISWITNSVSKLFYNDESKRNFTWHEKMRELVSKAIKEGKIDEITEQLGANWQKYFSKSFLQNIIDQNGNNNNPDIVKIVESTKAFLERYKPEEIKFYNRIINEEGVDSLLAKTTWPNLQTKDGTTALNQAMDSREGLVTKLLEDGADPNEGGKFKKVPLVELVKSGKSYSSDSCIRKIKELIAYGADVNAKIDCMEETALGWAAVNGNKRVVELLLSYNADPLQKDGHNVTPYDLAKKYGAKDVIPLMEKAIEDRKGKAVLQTNFQTKFPKIDKTEKMEIEVVPPSTVVSNSKVSKSTNSNKGMSR